MVFSSHDGKKGQNPCGDFCGDFIGKKGDLEYFL